MGRKSEYPYFRSKNRTASVPVAAIYTSWGETGTSLPSTRAPGVGPKTGDFRLHMAFELQVWERMLSRSFMEMQGHGRGDERGCTEERGTLSGS